MARKFWGSTIYAKPAGKLLKTGLNVCGNLSSSFLGEIAFRPGPCLSNNMVRERLSCE
jgi:hypothetical protein